MKRRPVFLNMSCNDDSLFFPCTLNINFRHLIVLGIQRIYFAPCLHDGGGRDGVVDVSPVAGIPNLGERSFRFLKRKTVGWLGFGSPEDTNVTKRERKIYWWYGILGVLFTVFFVAIPILRLRYLLREESIYGGKLLFFLSSLPCRLRVSPLSHSA